MFMTYKTPIYFRYLFLLYICYFVSGNSITAQEASSFSCVICRGHHHFQDEVIYHDFTFKNEAPFMASAIGLGAAAFFSPNPRPLTVAEINLLDATEINRFDRSTVDNNSSSAQKTSDVFLLSVLVLPTIFLSNHSTKKDIIPLATMSLETVLVNYAFTTFAKKIARRTRPFAYNPDIPLSDKLEPDVRSSFYSGHTSHTAALSFFMAKVMTDYHPGASRGFKVGVWTFAASIPAITGYLRVRAGKHFPTDTIVGGITGGLIGILVPHLHKSKKLKEGQKVRLNGAVGIGSARLALQF